MYAYQLFARKALIDKSDYLQRFALDWNSYLGCESFAIENNLE